MKVATVTLLAVAAATAWMLVGCGANAPPTHPVVGRLESPTASLQALAGHTVEIALESDPHVRAAGEIQPDGSFELRSVLNGLVLEGATAGRYKARIVLSDDDPQKKTAAARLLPPRYLQFDKSGLALNVPSEGPVALKVVR